MPPVSFCNVLLREHAIALSDLRWRSSEPLSTRWRRPFRFVTNRASSGQGSLGLLHRVDPHRTRPLAAADLPQPDRLEHPLSRNRAALKVETSQRGGPAVVGLVANDSARNLRLSPDVPCRAVLRTSSRKQARTTAPKVPSAEGDSLAEVDSQAATEAAGTELPTPLLPPPTRALTRASAMATRLSQTALDLGSKPGCAPPPPSQYPMGAVVGDGK
jgi:hypothetical protein